MSRLIALAFVLGLFGTGTADAQVWKVKRGKAAATKPAKKASAARARPTLKKKAPAKPKKRLIELAPEEDVAETETDDRARDRDRDRERDPIEDEDPVIIRVEEVFD